MARSPALSPSGWEGSRRASESPARLRLQAGSPKEPHVSVPNADCLCDLLLFGGSGLTTRRLPGKRSESPRSGRKLPRASRPGRCPSVRLAQGQSWGVRAPAPGCRGSSSSAAPARVPASFSPRPLFEGSPAQPSPARVRFSTFVTVAKDRRTPHRPLKIRPPARAGTQSGGRALPNPEGGWGSAAGWRAGPGVRAQNTRPPAGGGSAGVAARTETRTGNTVEPEAPGKEPARR